MWSVRFFFVFFFTLVVVEGVAPTEIVSRAKQRTFSEKRLAGPVEERRTRELGTFSLRTNQGPLIYRLPRYGLPLSRLPD